MEIECEEVRQTNKLLKSLRAAVDEMPFHDISKCLAMKKRVNKILNIRVCVTFSNGKEMRKDEREATASTNDTIPFNEFCPFFFLGRQLYPQNSALLIFDCNKHTCVYVATNCVRRVFNLSSFIQSIVVYAFCQLIT